MITRWWSVILLLLGEVSKIRGAFGNALTVHHLSPSSSLFHGLLDKTMFWYSEDQAGGGVFIIPHKRKHQHMNGWRFGVVKQNLKAVLHNTWNSIKLRNLNVTSHVVRLFTVNLISYFQPSGGATLPFRRLLLQWELGLWIASPAANQIEFVVAHFRFSAALPPSITCRVVILIAESHWYAKTELSVLTGLLWPAGMWPIHN